MRRLALVCTLFLLASGLHAQKVEVSSKSERPNMEPLQRLFNRLSPSVMTLQGRQKKEGAVTVLGSAVVVAPGELVTNRHVVDSASWWVAKHGNRTWRAHVIWVDPDHDLALLRVKGLSLPAVGLDASSAPSVGEEVLAIGSPEGLEETLSEGIVSGLRRYQGAYVVQTSAPISPGSSGGGLFDVRGRLVGITTFGLVDGEDLNFALPAKWVKALLAIPAMRHRGMSGGQTGGNEAYEKVFTRASVVLNNVAAFTQLGNLRTSGSDKGMAASQLLSKAMFKCIVDKTSPDCIDNWPPWQQASLLMFQLRVDYDDLLQSNNSFARAIMGSVAPVWSDLSDIYCQGRPGGLFTNLEDKIRACP